MSTRTGYRPATERIVPSYRRRDVGLLVVGFLALAVAVVAAHRSPATRHELSLYAATPPVFWAGAAVATVCALVVAFSRPTRPARLAAYLLAGETFLAVAGLPLLRGYEYFTTGDALSHMGWARDIIAGDLASIDIIYPGLHVVSVYVHRLLGLSLETSMQLTVLFFAAAFLVFVPLVVAALTDSVTATSVAVFAAAMVIPVNNISVHFAVFPSTVAIFFVPFLLVLAVVVLTRSAGRLVTPVDGLVALGSVAVVLLHPQQAVNLLLVFATVSAAVLVYRYRSGDRSLDPFVGHTAFLAAVTTAWSLSHDRIMVTATAYTETVAGVLTGQGPTGGGSIAQRAGSLSELGVSRLELGLKLFVPALVFSVLTVLLVMRSLRHSARDDDRLTEAVVGLGLVPVGAVMLLYVFGRLQSISFRHLGFIMAMVTVFGSVGLAYGMERLSVGEFRRSGVALGTVVLAALLVVSALTLFPSPFIYQPNGQVTEMQMTGHETAFAHEADGIQYVGIRSGPERFRHAIEGTGTSLDLGDSETERVPYGRLDEDLTTVFDGPRYLVVSRADVQREAVVWRNLRYSDRGLRTVGNGPGVDRVVTNGDFRLYYVRE